MRFPCLFALLATAAALPAQTSLQAVPQTTARATPQTHLQSRVQAQAADRQLQARVAVLAASANGCPVAFAARRTPGGNFVQTRGRAGTHSLAFDVSFGANPETNAITGARITLHGFSGVQLMPASPQGADGNATESLSLFLDQAHNAGTHTIAYARKLTGVLSIELNELTYKDGKHWLESPETPCRISPNGFLPVAAGN